MEELLTAKFTKKSREVDQLWQVKIFSWSPFTHNHAALQANPHPSLLK
jgi:hypothetical protein